MNFRITLLDLSTEVLVMILTNVLISRQGVLGIGRNIDPLRVLKRYRYLILTCRKFKWIIDNYSPKIAMYLGTTTTQGNFFRPKVWISDEHDPRLQHKHTFLYTNYRELFQTFQLHCALNTGIHYFDHLVKVLGKFWQNPSFSPSCLSELYSTFECDARKILLLLQDFLKRHRFHIATAEETNIRNASDSSGFALGELLHRIEWPEQGELVYSVANWMAIDNHNFSGLAIMREVSEWWVWPNPSNRGSHKTFYFSGYIKSRSWVVDAHTRKIYSNFEAPHIFGHRGGETRKYGPKYWLEPEEHTSASECDDEQ